ncbi:MAG: hypothetical protein K6L76_09850 [Agarilytica sp.]
MTWQREQQAQASECWKKKEKQHKQDIEKLYKDWQKENGFNEEQSSVVSVPYNHQESETVPQERIDFFIEHLRTLTNSLEQVEQETKFVSPFDTHPHQNVAQFLPHLCGTCRGRCCNKGKINHAFIQRSTILSILDSTPSLDAETLIDEYHKHIPEKSVTNSCIYHTDSGCNLDSSLRANICDDFYCLDLNNFIDTHQNVKGPHQVLAVAKDQCEVITWKTIPGRPSKAT